MVGARQPPTLRSIQGALDSEIPSRTRRRKLSVE